MNDVEVLSGPPAAERSRAGGGLRTEPIHLILTRAKPNRALALIETWAVYLAATLLGLAIHPPSIPFAIFWPAAGVLAGGLAVVVPRDRALFLIGICLVAFLARIGSGEAALPAAAFAAANVLEGAVFIAIYGARKWPLQLGGPRQVCRFIGAAILACAISGIFAGLILAESGFAVTAMFLTWLRWCVADFIGIVAIAPCFLALNMSALHRRIDVEAVSAMVCGLAMSALIFFTPADSASQLRLLPVSLIFPFLFWCGARCSPLANAVLASLLAVIVMYAVGHGLGPFSSLGWPVERRIFASQNFVLVIGSGSLLLSILFAERRVREGQLASALEAQKALLYEVNHRVKNSLQLVTSILTIEATKLRDPDARAALDTARSRIDIIARLHRRLYSSKRHAVVDLGEVLQETAEGVLRSAGRDDITLVASIGRGILMDVGDAAPIALALAEIVTNSVKHAFRQGGGIISLELTRVDDNARLKVRDDGPGFPKDGSDTPNDGLGMRIIGDLFRQSGAVIDTESHETGVSYVVDIPFRDR